MALPEKQISVEIFYLTPQSQWSKALLMEAPATVRQVVQASGFKEVFPGLPIETLDLGIFSKACGLDDTVSAHDRIEIYSPLLQDPKEQRRQKAALQSKKP